MQSSRRVPFIQTVDGWAIIIGLFILLAGIILFFTSVPENYKSLHKTYHEIMSVESQHAPFKTVECHLAYGEQQRLRSDKTRFGMFLDKFTGRPHSWSNNPLSSIYRTESSAGISDPEKENNIRIIFRRSDCKFFHSYPDPDAASGVT
jgi:hypothetical protein